MVAQEGDLPADEVRQLDEVADEQASADDEAWAVRPRYCGSAT